MIGLEINIEKSMNMLLTYYQNGGQNREVKIEN
jgi:hypothetical protein